MDECRALQRTSQQRREAYASEISVLTGSALADCGAVGASGAGSGIPEALWLRVRHLQTAVSDATLLRSWRFGVA